MNERKGSTAGQQRAICTDCETVTDAIELMLVSRASESAPALIGWLDAALLHRRNRYT